MALDKAATLSRVFSYFFFAVFFLAAGFLAAVFFAAFFIGIYTSPPIAVNAP
jgi:hypothetical protein